VITEIKPVGGDQKVIKTITSQSLFGDAQMIEIKHGTQTYQLRLTKAGKLILTK
jgi:hemin uptake protein HemP